MRCQNVTLNIHMQNDGFLLRLATPLDLPEINILVQDGLHAFGLQYDNCTSERDLALFSQTYFSRGCAFFVLTKDGLIIGTVGLVRLNEETVKLRKMYIHKVYKGRGLGYRLLKEAVEAAEAMQYREIILETVHIMHDAIRLYQKFGFSVISGKCGSPRCDVLMRLSLDQREVL